MKTFTTHKGKTIEMFYFGRNLALKFKEGGELPEVLQGMYTNEREAEIAITKYLDVHTPNHKKSTISEAFEEVLAKE